VPLLKVIGEHVLPLKSQLDWGYHIPFMVSGVLDRHPNDAMQWMDSDRRDDLVGFYQSVTSELDD
jgi:4-hydroxy 2-oxovalerate aldolase